MIDFASLDLRDAFDFAIMMEEDAEMVYGRLAERLGDDPGGAGEVFRTMAETEAGHRKELLARRSTLFRDAPPRIEISVIDGERGVERPDIDDELPRTAIAALESALAAEQNACRFYGQLSTRIEDPEVQVFCRDLIDQEAEHVAALAERIAQRVGAAAGKPRRRPPVPGAASERDRAEPIPDREQLTSLIPRFDAATQFVARAVLVEGVGLAEVAAALNVLRSTVARKLDLFLRMARRLAAGALVAATVMSIPGVPTPPAVPEVGAAVHGAAGDRRAPGVGEQAADRAASAPAAESAPPALTDPAAEHDRLEARILAHVAGRMPRHLASTHERVAKAVIAESALAGVDPLLVLAVIHVESTFDPDAVSNHGAAGLMQLKNRTMRDVLKRSGLPPADPRDPVANVRAGVRYLGQLKDSFGRLDTALMAYNAGPTRIRSHLRAGTVPRRYRGYPAKVLSEMARLRDEFGAGAPPA